MKKILVLASMLFLLFSVSVFADEPETVTSGDYEYILLEDGTAEIVKYSGEATELEVPGELDGYTVTSIGDKAFWDCDSLSSITLQEGLTSIGDDAFFSCDDLIITVQRDSYAAQYCEENGLNFGLHSSKKTGNTAIRQCFSQTKGHIKIKHYAL